MASGRTNTKQICQATSTQDDFIHECTCNLAVKQFRKEIKQLESATRMCNCQKKLTRVNRTPVKTANKTLLYTPSKNKTWFEVLAESPKKPVKENYIAGCNSSCKYATIFTTKTSDEENSRTKNRQFELLMDILYKKICESHNPELLNIFKELSNVMSTENHEIKYKQAKEFSKARPKPSSCYEYPRKNNSTDEKLISQKYNTLKKKLSEMEKPVEKSKEVDNITVKALIKLLENMQSVNEKTDVQQEHMKHLTDLIKKLVKENKMLNDLKDNRIALEAKLASTITENKYLKERVEFLESQCKTSHHLLELKGEEITTLKSRVGKIRETISRKIDFNNHPDIDRSITLDLDDTVATVPSSHENFDVLIRPASSSPAQTYKIEKKEDEDSGIQSNAHDGKNKFSNNYKNAILELQGNVKKAMEEFKLDTKLNDISLDLSDATYKCSLSP